MVCHMHQPNVFVNSYYGYIMWDYESDAPHMWPEKQRYPTDSEMREILDRNPEEAAVRGKWSDPEFLKNVSTLNSKLKDTQFADYHGHGWNFRAVFKRNRKGALLDAQGNVVADDDPKKFDKAVHLSSIHLDVGMHCVDCHFAQTCTAMVTFMAKWLLQLKWIVPIAMAPPPNTPPCAPAGLLRHLAAAT